MTTNILLAIGLFWAFIIAVMADLVVADAACKYIHKRISNEGLNYLANVVIISTAFAVIAIMCVGAYSFLSDLFPGQLS